MGRKDNIKVFLRIRPEARGSKAVDYTIEHTFEDSTINFHLDRRQIADVVNHSQEDFRFRFDRVLDHATQQEEVFNTVAKDCVLSALDGYNSTIFAYGQTGSGKTYSVTGGAASYNDRGIIPRSLSLIYDEIAKRTDYSWTVRVSYLQIYNDTGQDLLNRGNDAEKVEDLPTVTIHETDDEIVLKGLEAHPSASVHEALNLLFLGDTNRLYCETPMNQYSSRSHCVFTVSLEARLHGSAVVRRSKLNLVDLAGSERVARTGVTGKILNEAKYINLSLHYLEAVIVALSEQAQGRRDHIPYRNSMMTKVLRDSLGGNCRTAMLATAHPGENQVFESLSTCRFALRVACIKQHAVVNEETDPAVLVRKLKVEIATLKERIAFLEQSNGGSGGGEPRQLSDDEMSRCRDAVQRFVSDSDPQSTIVGVASDYVRIAACFQILKQMVFSGGIGGGGGGGAGKSREGLSTPPTANDGSAPTSKEMNALREQVRTLQSSLQEKENELSLMFAIVEKHSAGGGHSGETGGGATAVLAAGPRDRPAIAQPQPQPQQQIQPRAGAVGAASMPDPAVSAVSSADRVALLAQQEALADDYNLDVLGDAALLKDRTAAFEAFRRSYRKLEQIEKAKADVQGRYAAAKALAAQANAHADDVKRHKAKVQQLRAERALRGGAEEGPDAEEAAVMALLTASKAHYHHCGTELGKEKERIDHMHLMMQRAQDQLVKDFESWFSLRQRQLMMVAPGTASGGAAGTRVAAGAGAGAAGVLPASRAPAPVAVVAPALAPPASAAAAAAPPLLLNKSLFGANGALGAAAGGVSALQIQQQQQQQLQAASLARTSSGAAFTHEMHQALRVQQQQQTRAFERDLGGDGGTSRPNPYAPQYPSTGDDTTDAEMARLYQARDSMRAKMFPQQ